MSLVIYREYATRVRCFFRFPVFLFSSFLATLRSFEVRNFISPLLYALSMDNITFPGKVTFSQSSEAS